MASPPAPPTTGIIDPKSTARFTLQLPESSPASYSAVRFNHKPSQSSGSRRTKITSTSNSTYKLDIVDRENDTTSAYSYAGRRKTTDKSRKTYVLRFDTEKQSCTLLPLAQSFMFNIRSTPWESSPEKLSEQYAQIQDKSESASSESESDDALGGVSDTDDANNPFNYRNYLGRPRKSSRSPSPGPSVASSTHLAPPKLHHGSKSGGTRDRFPSPRRSPSRPPPPRAPPRRPGAAARRHRARSPAPRPR